MVGARLRSGAGRTDYPHWRVRMGRSQQLTDQRREYHQPHGNQAKPCDSVDAVAKLHSGQG